MSQNHATNAGRIGLHQLKMMVSLGFVMTVVVTTYHVCANGMRLLGFLRLAGGVLMTTPDASTMMGITPVVMGGNLHRHLVDGSRC